MTSDTALRVGIMQVQEYHYSLITQDGPLAKLILQDSCFIDHCVFLMRSSVLHGLGQALFHHDCENRGEMGEVPSLIIFTSAKA